MFGRPQAAVYLCGLSRRCHKLTPWSTMFKASALLAAGTALAVGAVPIAPVVVSRAQASVEAATASTPTIPTNLASVLLPPPLGFSAIPCSSYCGAFNLARYSKAGLSAGPADVAELRALGFVRGYYTAERDEQDIYAGEAYVFGSPASARTYFSWSSTSPGLKLLIKPGTLTYFGVPNIPQAVGFSYIQKPLSPTNSRLEVVHIGAFAYGRAAIEVAISSPTALIGPPIVGQIPAAQWKGWTIEAAEDAYQRLTGAQRT
jgi:hypothetical protein